MQQTKRSYFFLLFLLGMALSSTSLKATGEGPQQGTGSDPSRSRLHEHYTISSLKGVVCYGIPLWLSITSIGKLCRLGEKLWEGVCINMKRQLLTYQKRNSRLTLAPYKDRYFRRWKAVVISTGRAA